jgi:outer membrane biosynthesis protein TonB
MTDTQIVPPTTEAPSDEKSIKEVPKQTEDVEMKENGDRKSNNENVELVKSAEETNEKEDNGTNEDGDDDEDFLNAVSSNKDPDTPTRSKRKGMS